MREGDAPVLHCRSRWRCRRTCPTERACWMKLCEKAVDTVSDERVPAGSVEIRDYLMVFRRQWWLIVVLAVAGAVVATAWTLQRTPIYRGTSSVLVQPVSINRLAGTQRRDQTVDIHNEKQVALSSAVAVLAGKFLDSPATPDELLQHASVDVPP